MAQEGRRGLGRGLSALLGENEVSATLSETAAPPAQIKAWTHEVPIELLHPNPDQPRRVFSDAEIEELAGSIRDKGVIQPLLVRPYPGVGGEYEIVAGERRWRAAQKAGLRELPVVIRQLTEVEVLEIGIIENVQRVDLNPIEEAMAYKALMEKFGRTQEAVAEVVGKSRPHIANALRLLNLPDVVQDYVLKGHLSAGHARAIASMPDPFPLARRVIDEHLSVRETENIVRRWAESAGRPVRAKSPPAPRGKDADTVALEGDLSDALGLTVEILDKAGVGEVRVRYATLEQLDEVCRRLSRH